MEERNEEEEEMERIGGEKVIRMRDTKGNKRIRKKERRKGRGRNRSRWNRKEKEQWTEKVKG